MDKATGLLGRQFLIAYWFPVFISLALAILIEVYIYGWEAALSWWQRDWMLNQQRGFYAQIWFIVGFLITVTVLAYLLKPFNRLMIQFYEGYWPSLTLQKIFTSLPLLGEKNIWIKKNNQLLKSKADKDWQKYNRLYTQLFYCYPLTEDLIMPTRLGNTLRAAEDYSNISYGMDSIFWWQRLWPLLPDTVRKEIDDSLVSLVALLNFTTLIMTVTIFGSYYLRQASFDRQAWLELFIGIILAYISYRAAVLQAEDYGENIRAAIDLYRFNLLKALHQKLPKTHDDEDEYWDILLSWLYFRNQTVAANMKYNHDENLSEDSINR